MVNTNNASSALWKHQVNLFLQSFRSESFIISTDELSLALMKIILLLALMKSELTDRKLCNNKFTWCFHEAKLVNCFQLLALLQSKCKCIHLRFLRETLK